MNGGSASTGMSSDAAGGINTNEPGDGISQDLNNNLSANAGSQERISEHGPSNNSDVVEYDNAVDDEINESDFYQENKFRTSDEAAIDWGKKYNDNSIKDGKEYGSTIYKFKEKGKTYYSYSIPNRASGARVTVSKAPKGTTPVADIHSHGNAWGEGVEYSDNNFSGHDKDDNDNKKINGYLTTPNGSLKEYNYRTGKERVVNTNMPSDPKYPKFKKQY